MGQTETKTQKKEIVLRKPTRADHKHCVDLRNANKQHFFTPGHVTLAKHHAWYNKIERDETRVFYVVKLDGVVIGTAGLFNIDYYHRRAEYGQLVIGEQWRRNGYGRQTLAALLWKAFGELGLQRIYGDIYWNNVTSQRIAFSLGFREEGVFKNHIRTAEGEFVDVVRVAILKDDFNG